MIDSAPESLSGRSRIAGRRFLLGLAAVSVPLLLSACGGSPETAEFSRTSTLAATCAACHGTSGNSALEDIPSLAGQPTEDLLESIRTYRDDPYGSTSMHHLMRGYSDEELEQIAEYFSNLNPEGGQR